METIPQLPQDIIANILSRLPAKHLTQLKCVSKPWHSLISDPQFAKLHAATQSDNYRVLVVSVPVESVACESSLDDLQDIENKLISKIEFPAALKKAPDSDEWDWLDDWLDLGGSCNGLVCVVFDHIQRIFLWNPTTRETKELANLTDFDPKGKLYYGLGYDFSTDDYKVVRVARSSTAQASEETQVEVLALKSNTWRRVQGLHPSIILQTLGGRSGAGIFLHGALHWIAEITKTGGKISYGIVAFDMAEEKFFELVPVPDQNEERMNLGISGDCLCLFSGGGHEYTFLEGWVLKQYGIKSSWTRLFNVEKSMDYEYEYWEIALCYTKTGKVLLDYDGRALMWYDPEENTWETCIRWDNNEQILYVESLVSPNCCSSSSSTTTR